MGKPRKRMSEAERIKRADAKRVNDFHWRQRQKSKKNQGDSTNKPAIDFNVNVPPYVRLQTQAPESSIMPVGATQEPYPSYEHLRKGPVRPGQVGRPWKHKSREAALEAKKESDHRRYLREREERRRKKQVQRELKMQLAQPAQVIPEAQRQSITTTNESRDIEPIVPEEPRLLLSKNRATAETLGNAQKNHQMRYQLRHRT